MELVVVENVANHLVQHGEEGAKGSQTSEVHDVVQVQGVVQAASYQTICCEVGAE